MKRITSALLALLLIVLLAVPAFADGPDLNVKSAMLVDMDSDAVLYAESETQTIYPASLTKIMTGYLFARWVNEHSAWDAPITVSASAVADMDPDGSSAGLLAGERLTAYDLLACILIVSANEACNVAAETVSGSIPAFLELMNETADALDCTGTHFANPHGLHDAAHYTTAADLWRIVRAAIEDPTFWALCTTPSMTIPATNLSDARELHSSNYMTSTYMGYTYYDERIEGIKTGFTTPAGRCLIATARQDGHRLLSIVCGAPNTESVGGTEMYGHFVETAKLLDYGFANFDELAAQAQEVVVEPRPEPPVETPEPPAESEPPAEVETPADTPAAPEAPVQAPAALEEPDAPAAPEAPVQQEENVPARTHDKTLYLIAALAIFLILWIALYLALKAHSRKKK